jgi:hypothetical protein
MSNTTFTITLTDLELRGLEYVAASANDWIQNAVHERCRLAIDQLVNDEIQYRINNNLPINGTKEEIALASTLPSGAERNQIFLNQANAMYANQQTPESTTPQPADPIAITEPNT